jgi:hypothetical protein
MQKTLHEAPTIRVLKLGYQASKEDYRYVQSDAE